MNSLKDKCAALLACRRHLRPAWQFGEYREKFRQGL